MVNLKFYLLKSAYADADFKQWFLVRSNWNKHQKYFSTIVFISNDSETG